MAYHPTPEHRRIVESIVSKLRVASFTEALTALHYAEARRRRRVGTGALIAPPISPGREVELKHMGIEAARDLPDDEDAAAEILQEVEEELGFIHGESEEDETVTSLPEGPDDEVRSAVPFKIKTFVAPLSSLAASFAADECLCCLLRLHWLPVV